MSDLDDLESFTLDTYTGKKRKYDLNKSRIKGQLTAAANKRGATHCKRGHTFTAENTRYDKKGNRMCRECVNARKRVSRKKRHEVEKTS